ncbi:hypothetical protein LBMAG53_24060 [Planctomycetota bacterium]|nr:hypothetical protein LBMAG53_24060 [Planctomycetota bacterium]
MSLAVTVMLHGSTVVLANGLVAASVHLGSGSWALASLDDPLAALVCRPLRLADADGHHLVAGSAPCTWSEFAIDGPLGPGRRLRIVAPGQGDDRILELDLHAGRTGLVVGGGVRHHGPQPVRIGRIQLVDGSAFAGCPVAEGYAALDGESGCVPTRVHGPVPLRCRNNLVLRCGPGRPRCLVLGGLTYREFERFVAARPAVDSIAVELWAEDPVGRLVEPEETWVAADRSWIDLAGHDPFAVAEEYAWAVRLAQGVSLADGTYPTVCLWWASQGLGSPANDSPGAVAEMDLVAASGFLRYAAVGIRLLPDSYAKDNCDGWWDDAHWAACAPTFAPPGPCYKQPWPTTAAWCGAVRERGGVPISYMRANGRSEDYASAHPGHMLFNDPGRRLLCPVSARWWERDWPEAGRDLVGCDFTDPGFQAHVRQVYAGLRQAGLAGIFYDYPKITGWIAEGGFEDPQATTAAAYRQIFALAREGLGPEADLQERAYFLGSDVAIGLANAQRVIWDNSTWAPTLLARVARRWYKNRVVMDYDTDGKDLPAERELRGRDGVRAMLTMAAVASARILLATSFRHLDAELLHDLSRVVPLPALGRTARPLDLFAGGDCPQIFDLRIEDGWHQLTLYNTAVAAGSWPPVDLPLEPFTEGRRDFPGKVAGLIPVAATLAVELGAPAWAGGLGLDPAQRYYVYDFWNDRLAGIVGGGDRLAQDLRPAEARMLAIHQVEDRPQWIATDRHIHQGLVDLVRRPVWDPARRILAGTSRLVAGETTRVILATNGLSCTGATAAAGAAAIVSRGEGLLDLHLCSATGSEVPWEVGFS